MKNWYCYVLFLDEFRRVLPVSGDVELKEEDYNDIKSTEGRLRMANLMIRHFTVQRSYLSVMTSQNVAKRKMKMKNRQS